MHVFFGLVDGNDPDVALSESTEILERYAETWMLGLVQEYGEVPAVPAPTFQERMNQLEYALEDDVRRQVRWHIERFAVVVERL